MPSGRRLGKKHSLETRRKMSLWHLQNGTGKNLKGQHTSVRTEFKKGQFSGSKHPNWKNGISKTREYQNFHIKINKAKRRKVVGSFTFEQWEELKKQYFFTCLGCKKVEPEIKLTIDHIIPITKGGNNYIDNIQPLCGSCNARKSNKLNFVFGKIG